MKLNKVVEMIRGPEKTEVRLTIVPADADPSARKTISIIREKIKLEDQEAKAKIIELPVQFPTKYQLVVNMKTAKAIDLTIPATFLLHADELIE